jgi:hypothetical protein
MLANAATLDDCATVWTTPAGAPARFVYRGKRFTVVTRPQFWIDRLPWWTRTGRAPAGGGAGLLEQPMWHVTAATEGAPPVTFDLAADPDSNYWPVTGVYDGSAAA